MSTADFLNMVLAFGFIVIILCIAFTSFFLVQALKAITNLVDNLDDTTKDVQIIKNKIKMGLLTGLSTLLATFATGVIRKRKGGEKK